MFLIGKSWGFPSQIVAHGPQLIHEASKGKVKFQIFVKYFNKNYNRSEHGQKLTEKLPALQVHGTYMKRDSRSDSKMLLHTDQHNAQLGWRKMFVWIQSGTNCPSYHRLGPSCELHHEWHSLV